MGLKWPHPFELLYRGLKAIVPLGNAARYTQSAKALLPPSLPPPPSSTTAYTNTRMPTRLLTNAPTHRAAEAADREKPKSE